MPGTRLYVNTYITDEDGNVIRDLTKSIKEPAKVCIEFKNISEAPLNISSDELMERFVRGDSSRNTEEADSLIHYKKLVSASTCGF